MRTFLEIHETGAGWITEEELDAMYKAWRTETAKVAAFRRACKELQDTDAADRAAASTAIAMHVEPRK